MLFFRTLGLIVCALLFAEPCLAFKQYAFRGNIDLEKKRLDITFDQDDKGLIATTFEQRSDNGYKVSINLDHFKTPNFQISSDIESQITLGHTVNELIKGTISSKNSFYDQKPVNDMTGNFEVKEHAFNIYGLTFGHLFCAGSVSLVYPYDFDLSIKIESVDLDDFLRFWVPNKKYESAGDTGGYIKVTGDIDRLNLQGELVSNNGFVDELYYDNIVLNISGDYPNMQISQSSVNQTNGPIFKFEGPFNLADRENFKKQIQELSLAPMVDDNPSQMQWTIKRSQEGKTGSTELKYLWRKGDELGALSNEDSGLIGILRTVEF